MSKKTRKESKEKEKRNFAEKDEAMKAGAEKSGTPAQENGEEPKKRYKHFGLIEDKTPENIHCHKCKTLMENGVCPTCGYRLYVPMDEDKKKKIRWIVGGVCLVVFIILFIWMQIKE